MPWITKDGRPIFIKGATAPSVVPTRSGTYQATSATKAYGPPPEGKQGFNGHSTTSVIRAAAKHGLDREQTKQLLTRMNLSAAQNTVYIQHARGKAGEQIPVMAPHHEAEFLGHVAAIKGGGGNTQPSSDKIPVHQLRTGDTIVSETIPGVMGKIKELASNPEVHNGTFRNLKYTDGTSEIRYMGDRIQLAKGSQVKPETPADTIVPMATQMAAEKKSGTYTPPGSAQPSSSGFKVGQKVDIGSNNLAGNQHVHMSYGTVERLTPTQVHVRNEHGNLTKFYHDGKTVGYKYPHMTTAIKAVDETNSSTSAPVHHTGDSFGNDAKAAEMALAAGKQRAAEGHYAITYKEGGTGEFKVKAFSTVSEKLAFEQGMLRAGHKMYGKFDRGTPLQ